MKKVFFALSLILLSACQPTVNLRGNDISECINKVEIGKSTMFDVVKTFGTPSLYKDKYSWVYIGSVAEESSFKRPVAVNQCIVRVQFDENGFLKHIENIKNTNKYLETDKESTNLIKCKCSLEKKNEIKRK